MRTVSNSSSYPSRAGGVRLVVVHTAETPCEEGRAYNIAAYLANLRLRYKVDINKSALESKER